MLNIFIVAVMTLAISIDVPVLPNKYELDFTQHAKFGPISGDTTGKIIIDADNNRELVTRINGKADRYCGTVYKLSNTPCNHYILENKRFLDFPDKKYCCFCCDSTHGCGIVKSDWLVTANATFSGNQTLQGDTEPSAKWTVKGNSSLTKVCRITIITTNTMI